MVLRHGGVRVGVGMSVDVLVLRLEIQHVTKLLNGQLLDYEKAPLFS